MRPLHSAWLLALAATVRRAHPDEAAGILARLAAASHERGTDLSRADGVLRLALD